MIAFIVSEMIALGLEVLPRRFEITPITRYLGLSQLKI